MGARFRVGTIEPTWHPWLREWVKPEGYTVDIRSDRRGPFFELRVPEHLREALDVTVMQSKPKDRHLLMMVRNPEVAPRLDRFLCGHDEREWFVAAVPGGASSVQQAMAALQPTEVQEALARYPVSRDKRCSRKNRAFRRQGEWFFVPEPKLVVRDRWVLRNEPIRRGSGKPHLVEQLYRKGGRSVRVCSQFPDGVLEADYQAILRENPNAARWGWRQMRRDPRVYARGTVRHRDHQTINLPFWHRVVMNTESQSPTMRNMAFLD